MPIPIQSILIATDLSPQAGEAIGAAAALADLTGAALHVMHAVEPRRGGYDEGVLGMQRRIHVARTGIRRELGRVDRRSAVGAATHVAYAQPTAAILSTAREVSADLLVIGPHRTRPFGDQVLGSTADQLVRECSIPCLIVRGPVQVPPRRIVLPSDLSPVAQGSLVVALQWADALNGDEKHDDPTSLTVVHVDSANAPTSVAIGSRYGIWRQLEGQVQDAVSRARSEVSVDQEVLQGTDPADAIVRFAQETAADLLVMGTRGDPPILKALLASVSSAVSRACEVPVLLIPPRLWSAESQNEVAAVAEAVPLPPFV